MVNYFFLTARWKKKPLLTAALMESHCTLLFGGQQTVELDRRQAAGGSFTPRGITNV